MKKLELSDDEFKMNQGVLGQVAARGRKDVKTLNSLLEKFEVPEDDPDPEKQPVSAPAQN